MSAPLAKSKRPRRERVARTSALPPVATSACPAMGTVAVGITTGGGVEPWLLFAALACGLLLGAGSLALVAWRLRRRAEIMHERALASERLAQVGTLTSGLAHEIKNPLSTINLNFQLLEEDLRGLQRDAPDQLRDRLGSVERRFISLHRETERLRETLEDFLRFAGRMELEPQAVDVNQLVGSLVDFFTPQAQSAGIHLRVSLEADPAEARLDAALVKQAILNLMLNAVQAMKRAREQNLAHGGGEELIIRTQRHRVMGRPELHVHVIDTGPGVEPTDREAIFRPYVSRRRGGNGLGLPLARRITEEHGGRLTLHSEPGRGSDFAICLPVDESDGASAEASLT